MESSYTLGLHEVGNGCFAYLQPDGGWGYSNAGLVVGEGESLLVDTLFDLKLTQQMLDSMVAAASASPPDQWWPPASATSKRPTRPA